MRGGGTWLLQVDAGGALQQGLRLGAILIAGEGAIKGLYMVWVKATRA